MKPLFGAHMRKKNTRFGLQAGCLLMVAGVTYKAGYPFWVAISVLSAICLHRIIVRND